MEIVWLDFLQKNFVLCLVRYINFHAKTKKSLLKFRYEHFCKILKCAGLVFDIDSVYELQD